MTELFGGVYKNKRVLVTGHTGFKGSWLAIWLRELGAEVVGYALEPKTENDNFVVAKLGRKIKSVIGDVRDYKHLQKVFAEFQPEFVFHLAAQSLVKQSYEEPVTTLNTNIMGTVNILEAIRMTDSVRVGVMITSDKCYENKEWTRGYRETDRLGGHDPYSASKACAELVISSYRDSFYSPTNYAKHRKSVASARAGNVIGGGDWAQDRIMPDCIRALEKNKPILVRNPQSTRPWQHVLEPISGYLLLGQKMYEEPGKYEGAWNFGPDLKLAIPVEKLVALTIKYYGRGSWEKAPEVDGPHEAKLLALDCSKAKKFLGWKSALDMEKTVELTVDWYKKYQERKDCYGLAVEETRIYLQEAKKRGSIF